MQVHSSTSVCKTHRLDIISAVEHLLKIPVGAMAHKPWPNSLKSVTESMKGRKHRTEDTNVSSLCAQ